MMYSFMFGHRGPRWCSTLFETYVWKLVCRSRRRSALNTRLERWAPLPTVVPYITQRFDGLPLLGSALTDVYELTVNQEGGYNYQDCREDG